MAPLLYPQEFDSFLWYQRQTIGGWHALFQTLQDPHCRVEELNLASNNITNKVAAELANSLSNNRVLKKLYLSINLDVTTER